MPGTIQRTCPECGTKFPTSQRSCPSCGTHFLVARFSKGDARTHQELRGTIGRALFQGGLGGKWALAQLLGCLVVFCLVFVVAKARQGETSYLALGLGVLSAVGLVVSLRNARRRD
ncbi:MAG: hypothetical protein H6833_12675 [Planctomycetes bacterium]|nr:hypothetical protein [Planctomycetota bacterium]